MILLFATNSAVAVPLWTDARHCYCIGHPKGYASVVEHSSIVVETRLSSNLANDCCQRRFYQSTDRVRVAHFCVGCVRDCPSKFESAVPFRPCVDIVCCVWRPIVQRVFVNRPVDGGAVGGVYNDALIE